MARSGYVYLMRDKNGYCKIGKSNNPTRRLSQLRNEYTKSLELIYSFYSDDAFKWESFWKREFEIMALPNENEWFYLLPFQIKTFCDTPISVKPKPPRHVKGEEHMPLFLQRLCKSVLRIKWMEA